MHQGAFLDGEDDGGVVFTGSWPAGVGLVFEAAGVGGDEGFGFGNGLALGATATDRHPPNAVRAPAMELVDEFKAHLVLERLNQMAARIRGNLVRIALAESMIHWPFVTPAGSPAMGSALAHSASIIGLVAFKDATREYVFTAVRP